MVNRVRYALGLGVLFLWGNIASAQSSPIWIPEILPGEYPSNSSSYQGSSRGTLQPHLGSGGSQLGGNSTLLTQLSHLERPVSFASGQLVSPEFVVSGEGSAPLSIQNYCFGAPCGSSKLTISDGAGSENNFPLGAPASGPLAAVLAEGKVQLDLRNASTNVTYTPTVESSLHICFAKGTPILTTVSDFKTSADSLVNQLPFLNPSFNTKLFAPSSIFLPIITAAVQAVAPSPNATSWLYNGLFGDVLCYLGQELPSGELLEVITVMTKDPSIEVNALMKGYLGRETAASSPGGIPALKRNEPWVASGFSVDLSSNFESVIRSGNMPSLSGAKPYLRTNFVGIDLADPNQSCVTFERNLLPLLTSEIGFAPNEVVTGANVMRFSDADITYLGESPFFSGGGRVCEKSGIFLRLTESNGILGIPTLSNALHVIPAMDSSQLPADRTLRNAVNIQSGSGVKIMVGSTSGPNSVDVLEISPVDAWVDDFALYFATDEIL
ncbi:hypothetical protein MRY87_02560 [bacterium]|nr:hypothetical protein [bacterium]